MKELFTIGYEQAKPSVVMDEITGAKIDILVDVRAVTSSRRPGFSKNQLAAALAREGVDYLHLQKLGTPAAGRQAARAGDYKRLWEIFDKHIKSAPAQEELDTLAGLVKSGQRVCLMCYCRDPAHCHRSRISALVKKRTRARVKDLIPPLF
jgi:uncharacterized protein (DUF488 family)